MKTTDIFPSVSSKKLNESLSKTFGKTINLEDFTLDQLQDARNKLRTKISQFRNDSTFNETVENENHLKTQWMLDVINKEIAEREEFIVDGDNETVEETSEEVDVEEDFEVIEADDESSSDDSDESFGIYDGYDFKEDQQTQGFGESMNTHVNESELDKASAVVSAKGMVDKVSRWIEELAGIENDTLLSLGDSIRDEMGQEQAKAFLSQVAPAIQQALDTLKQARETMSTGVRALTGEVQPAEMLGSPEAGEGDVEAPAEPDAMNPEPSPEEAAIDDFAAAEPAVGADEAGRAQRESIDRSSRLMKVLAG